MEKEIGEFYICGYCFEMDYDSINYSNDMVAYWHKYEENNIEERLYNELNPNKHGEIGIIIRDSSNSTKYKYLLGVMAQDKSSNTDSLKKLKILVSMLHCRIYGTLPIWNMC